MAETYDMIIALLRQPDRVDAGGLSAAVYAGRAERKALLIEKGSYGGRINETREIRNYPGTIGDTGIGLMEKFKAHALAFPTNELKRTTVTGIKQLDNGNFLVQTKRRGDFETRCVLLDLGTKPRVLGIPGVILLVLIQNFI